MVPASPSAPALSPAPGSGSTAVAPHKGSTAPAGLAPQPRPAWSAATGAPPAFSTSPRLLETILGAGLIMETAEVPGLQIPLAEFTAILLLVVASFRPPRRDLSRFGLLAVLAAALMVYLVAVTVVNDLDPSRRAIRITVLILFIYALASERLDLKGVLYGMAAGAVVNVPLFYAGIAPDAYQGYLTGFLGDKNVSGLFYALIPLLLMTVVQRFRVRVLILGAGFVLTFLTGSRTSLAALICATLWILLSPYLGRVLRLLLIYGMSLLVNWAEEDLAKLSVFGDRTGTDWFRSLIQAESAAKAAAAPWYGEGLSTAVVELEQGQFFFHNSYLALLVEGGWVFLTVVVGAYVLLCLRPFALSRRSPSRVALEAATVVVLVTSLQLGEVFITLYGAIILGLGLLLTHHERATDRAEAEASRRSRSARIVAQARRDGLRSRS